MGKPDSRGPTRGQFPLLDPVCHDTKVLRDLVKTSAEPLLRLSQNDKLVVHKAEHPAQPGDRLPRFPDLAWHPDSLGRGAGEAGRVLGADIALLGPGEAYERWKKTPEYQEWLEKTNEFNGER